MSLRNPRHIRQKRGCASLAGAGHLRSVKTTDYFDAIRCRPDRRAIRDEWILRAISNPLREYRQRDGKIRRWTHVPEAGGRYLRVVLLEDGGTVHNAFFDRRYEP